MIDGLEQRPVRGRAAKQERSERVRSAIAEGVIAVLASHGVAGLTHRRVALASGASLAATTYYFASKADMVAEASNALLRRYLDVFADAAAHPAGEGYPAYRNFVSRVAANGLERDRTPLLAWFEIMLDGTRQPDARALARSWYVGFDQVWRQLAEGFDLGEPERAARAGVDITVGAMAHGLSLGWTPQQSIDAITGVLPADTLLDAAMPDAPEPTPARAGSKAEQTRYRLRQAAIQLLAEGGAEVLTYRAVATRSGLSAAAPVYHFGSSDHLLAEAQRTLFAGQKARYREVMADAFPGLTLETLVELTAVIFQREATEYGTLNVAGYAIWMEAARKPELRTYITPVLTDLHRAWQRLLKALGVAGDCAFEALCIQFLFVGAQIRVLASGSPPRELVRARNQLKEDITALAQGRHWLQSGGRPA
jgi:DNA-binding transcriptional regulator YbjK